MRLTLAECEAMLDAAYAAIHLGELSFTGPNDRQTTFHSLDQFRRYIDWLEGRHAQLTAAAAADSDSGGYAPKVRFKETSP